MIIYKIRGDTRFPFPSLRVLLVISLVRARLEWTVDLIVGIIAQKVTRVLENASRHCDFDECARFCHRNDLSNGGRALIYSVNYVNSTSFQELRDYDVSRLLVHQINISRENVVSRDRAGDYELT